MAPNDESMRVEQKQDNSVEDNVPQEFIEMDDAKSNTKKEDYILEGEKQDYPSGNPSKKRKVAMYLAYVGHDYQGMQRNPGAKTIEDELFRAIHKAGGISDSNADEKGFTKVGVFSFEFLTRQQFHRSCSKNR
jgi:tRNA pseudouridine38-40 synthase